jgi:probable F420-dependent oxidoreductase
MVKLALGWVFFGHTPFESEILAHYAQEADRLGFEALWVVEHVVIPIDFQTPFPHANPANFTKGKETKLDGKYSAYDEKRPYPDPIVTLSFAAGLTRNIKLGTNIVILPQRNPLIFAKEVATLDALSGGRTFIGVAAGWLKEEFEAVGADYHTRGARTDEAIQVLREVWTNHPASFDGKYYKFGPVDSHPKPVQTGGPPIFIGGIAPPVLKRIARYGDGWMPPPHTPEQFKAAKEMLRDEFRKAGRDFDELKIFMGTAGSEEGILRAKEQGATTVAIVPPFTRDKKQLTQDLEKLALLQEKL